MFQGFLHPRRESRPRRRVGGVAIRAMGGKTPGTPGTPDCRPKSARLARFSTGQICDHRRETPGNPQNPGSPAPAPAGLGSGQAVARASVLGLLAPD